MQALRIITLGAPPVLADVPEPVPAASEVLVRVRAAGLNFADLLRSRGRYQEREDPPFTLGMECAGVVEATGPGVDGLTRGTPVLAFSGTGALAEFATVPAAACLPIPDGMPFDHAAAFPVAYGTSHLALSHRARLARGETLLVLGAGGGVGLTAVEIGARMGARVIAAARGAEKRAAARAAGAETVLDGDAPDLADRVKALGGADVVYDPVGGAAFAAGLRACRPEGRILVIGFASGTVPPVPANVILVKNVDVIGFYWGGYLRFRPRALTDSLGTLLDWYAEGGLRPHIGLTLPLARAAEGLARLESRQATGKVVVTMP